MRTKPGKHWLGHLACGLLLACGSNETQETIPRETEGGLDASLADGRVQAPDRGDGSPTRETDGGRHPIDARRGDVTVGTIQVCPPGSEALVPDLANTTVERVPDVPPDDGYAAGFAVLEGPVWREGALYLSHFAGGSSEGRILRVSPGQPATVFIPDAATNGLATNLAGDLFGARHGDGTVSEFDTRNPNAPPSPLIGMYMGSRFNSPNDLILGEGLSFYFTDPDWQAPDPNPQPEERAYYVTGSRAIAIAPEVAKPNGIALSVDGDTLYVGGTNGLYRYTVAPDGTVGMGTSVAAIAGGVDGLGRDCAGNIYVTTGSSVVVLDQNTNRLGALAIPQSATNVAFGGSDRRTLYVTTLGDGPALYRAELNVPGYPY